MRYTGETCPVCHMAFGDEDDVVVCPACGTPHHRSCYTLRGDCANASLHSEGFVWMPAVPDGAKHNAPVSTLLTDKPSKDTPDDGHNIVFCPECGAENAAEEPVCTQCGARLYNNANAGAPFLPPVQLPDGAQRLYGAGAAVMIAPTDEIDGNTVADTAEYVQANARKYIPRFYAMEKTGKKISWNWASFFFAPYWYFFRKLYAVGAVLMLLELLVVGCTTTPRMIEQTDAFYDTAQQIMTQMDDGSLSRSEAMQAYTQAYMQVASIPEYIIASGCNFAIALFSGLFGNYLYKKKAAKDIARLRAQSKSPEEYRLLLFRRGGMSVLMCIAAFWIYELGTQVLSVAISRFLM